MRCYQQFNGSMNTMRYYQQSNGGINAMHCYQRYNFFKSILTCPRRESWTTFWYELKKTADGGRHISFMYPFHYSSICTPISIQINIHIRGVSPQLSQRGARASNHAIFKSCLRYQYAFQKIMS